MTEPLSSACFAPGSGSNFRFGQAHAVLAGSLGEIERAIRTRDQFARRHRPVDTARPMLAVSRRSAIAWSAGL